MKGGDFVLWSIGESNPCSVRSMVVQVPWSTGERVLGESNPCSVRSMVA